MDIFKKLGAPLVGATLFSRLLQANIAAHTNLFDYPPSILCAFCKKTREKHRGIDIYGVKYYNEFSATKGEFVMKSFFRNDEYGKNFYIEKDGNIYPIPYSVGDFSAEGLDFSVSENTVDGVLKISISVSANEFVKLDRLGFKLGIDCCMESYPEWNGKYFPTALRCEKNGFWSCFVTPEGKFLSVCSPSKIVSWKNEYSSADYDIVGHRIYTSCIELINTYPQPQRHPRSPEGVGSEPIVAEIYYYLPENAREMYSFIEKYSGIRVPSLSKYTIQQGEPLYMDGKLFDGELEDGVNYVGGEGDAQTSVFVRRDWFYYLDCARRSAEICQQKPGTHAESWYGYFSRVLYASIIKNENYTRELCEEFDAFFAVLTERIDGKCRMRRETLPERLQNSSAMLSLLADFYELTGERRYLDDANDLAEFLMTLQIADGSFRSYGTHYTCVIYPAKSMLELALVERDAGLNERYGIHYNSAYRAIKNLELLLDNIETEGQMTFEDGMISCESMQLGFLALQLAEGEERSALAAAAENIIQKHLCLEQQFVPDCRTRGCTMRFWEARYDVNFFSNMINAPHGWTSWKNYATYYLYMLTGKIDYLKDTMDTLGSCMQCVDKDGVLHWGFVVDPCIVGNNLKKGSTPDDIQTVTEVVGEQYLPMISDWWRQDPQALIMEYLEPWNHPERWKKCYGGSCDNDVHEHFKCLMESVFGKAFVHFEGERAECYNCLMSDSGFECKDKYAKTWVIYSDREREITLNGNLTKIDKGFNFIDLLFLKEK